MLLHLPLWRAPRGEIFCNVRLGHPFSVASGARSAEEIWLLQPKRAQRGQKFGNARLGHPFSLVSGARRGEDFTFATLARPAQR